MTRAVCIDIRTFHFFASLKITFIMIEVHRYQAVQQVNPYRLSDDSVGFRTWFPIIQIDVRY